MQSERKHARRMSGGAPPSPKQVLKNQRDTPGRATTGQDPCNPRNYASSVRAQENGRTRHFRTRTLRTENHPEKVEMDKHRPGAREITMSRGRGVARSNARTAMPETRNHDHTLGREVRRSDISRSNREARLPEEPLASPPCVEDQRTETPR